MKIALVIFFSLMSLSSFAQISSVSSGTSIEASKINEIIDKINEMNIKIALNTLPVGTIISSFLTPSQYQAENGDCWKRIDGAVLSISDELRTVSGMTNLPDSLTEGTFLRQAKSGRTLGSYEDDSFESHTHTQNSHNHIQDAHNHTQDAHNHLQNAHVHAAVGETTARAAGGLTGWGISAGQSAPTAGVQAATATNIQSTATNQAATATNQSATAINQNTGGTETTPKNLAVNFFIKIKKQCDLI